jgi:predicted nucleic acid-binding protein
VPVVALDSSVILAWLIEDEGLRQHALGLRADLEAGLLAPIGAAPLPFELRNGLVKGARQGRFPWADVEVQIGAFDRWRMPIEPPPTDSRLLELCRDLGVGWGDAHWIDLSIRLGVPLITADEQLVRSLRKTAIWVEWLGHRPVG